MNKFMFSILTGLLLAPVFSQSVLASAYDLALVQGNLSQDLQAARKVEYSIGLRMRTIQKFVKDLKKLDDGGLGDPRLLAGQEKQENLAQAKVKLIALEEKLTGLVTRFEQDVKPILLNNVKLKRLDDTSKHNKGELAQLFFPSKYNHRTGRVVTGLWRYKLDISSSFFGKEMVDAGLAVNFPELEETEWLADAFNMEAELLALLRMHREYQDGVKYEKVKKTIFTVQDSVTVKKPGLSIVKPSITANAGVDMVLIEGDLLKASHDASNQSSEKYTMLERGGVVHKFVKTLKALDSVQEPAAFKHSLEGITALYQKEVKPILLSNVRLSRDDIGSRNNKGDILSLFFKKRVNHYTGKPVTGKLSHKEDQSESFFGEKKMVEVGILVDNPDLKNEKFIKDALLMEAELMVLSLQHKNYLSESAGVF